MDILKVKGWIIFLTFLFIFGPLSILLNYLASQFNDSVSTILGLAFFLILYFLYPFLVGLRLRSILSSQAHYNTKTNASIILDWLIVLVTISLTNVLNLQEQLLTVLVSTMGVVGIARLGAFPAHQIRSIELKRNAGIWEYFSETLQMIYWPLGVLWMQPRINKIANRAVKIEE